MNDVQARIRELASSPGIDEWLDAGEQSGHLAQPLLDAMFEAGIFRLLLPTWLDGYQLDLPDFVAATKALGAIDGSMAWCVGQGVGCSMSAAYLAPDAAKEVFGRPESVVAWGPTIESTTVAVDGGYRLSGRWRHASGLHHATWLGGRGPISNQDGSPRLHANGTPEVKTLLFPASEASITVIWNTLGLRATGTDAFSVDDIFVPDEFAFSTQDQSRRHDQSLFYALPLVEVYPIGFAGVMLGIGRAVLDNFERLATTKAVSHRERPLRDSQVVQDLVGRCEARLGAAHAYLLSTVEQAWEQARASGEFSAVTRRTIRLACSHAYTEATAVADRAYHAAGINAVLVGDGFERRMRDLRTATQQYQGRDEHYEYVGRDILAQTGAETSDVSE